MDKKLALFGVIIVGGLIAGSWFITTPWKRDKGRATVTITDMTGRPVEVPKKVDEVVGIEAGALRLITYLNATDTVVGVEQAAKEWGTAGRPYLITHPELSELPSIGPPHGGDAELIAAQNPDVIFWTYTTAGPAKDLQQKTGIPVIALKYGDLGEHRGTFYDALSLMGKVLNKEDRAEEVMQNFRSIIQDLENRSKNIPSETKSEVYVGGLGYQGKHGIQSTKSPFTPFQFVNATNVAGDLNPGHHMVNKEQIIEWDPDIIFIDEGGYSLVKEDLNDPEFKSLTAVENERLFGILPYNFYTHNYGTILADSYYIGKVLYPENFSDVNPREKTDEISNELVGGSVYDIMNQTFKGFQNLSDEIIQKVGTKLPARMKTVLAR